MNNDITTIDKTQAELILSLSKEGLVYQTILQECENLVFTRDNILETQAKLAEYRKAKSKLEAAENPHTKVWKEWNASKKSLVDPLAAVVSKKEAECAKVSREIAAENARIEAEKQRKIDINKAIDTFFLDQSQAIAAATEPSELVRIEKLIGSHKGNSSRYQEFLPQMAQKAEILAELIKTQKDAIKKIADLRAKEQAAMKSGNDEAVLEIREKQEEITAKIEQGKNDVQEAAIKMATQADVVEAEVIQMPAPKARYTTWKYEVVDWKAAEKAGLTKLIIDEEKIDAVLKDIRETETETTKDGVRYFILRKF